jgi:ring-1,2-phenylacetyl-CoA epoxidase subunit PaaD
MDSIALMTEKQLDRLRHRQASADTVLWDLLDAVKDPEIPVLSIWDLGILQDVSLMANTVKVVITPTYCGCPAMQDIENQIRSLLAEAGYESVDVERRLAPAWTTDWMSSDARQRLREYGIAAPVQNQTQAVPCPQCGSHNTAPISEFGSTACKALYQCADCLEPFDYFKCI